MWAAGVPEQPSLQLADVLVLAIVGLFALRGDGFIDRALDSFDHVLVSHDAKHQFMFRRIARPNALYPIVMELSKPLRVLVRQNQRTGPQTMR
jgi:hypothetical protein